MTQRNCSSSHEADADLRLASMVWFYGFHEIVEGHAGMHEAARDMLGGLVWSSSTSTTSPYFHKGASMKHLIRLEELALTLLAVYLFAGLEYAWWWFPLLLAPDLSALGYLAGPRVGSYSYNLIHHKGLALLTYVVGTAIASPPLQLAGLILLAHSSLDRVFSYGLKHADAFQHTHLGWIGKSNSS
jgi:hypothetical protein